MDALFGFFGLLFVWLVVIVLMLAAAGAGMMAIDYLISGKLTDFLEGLGGPKK